MHFFFFTQKIKIISHDIKDTVPKTQSNPGIIDVSRGRKADKCLTTLSYFFIKYSLKAFHKWLVRQNRELFLGLSILNIHLSLSSGTAAVFKRLLKRPDQTSTQRVSVILGWYQISRFL